MIKWRHWYLLWQPWVVLPQLLRGAWPLWSCGSQRQDTLFLPRTNSHVLNCTLPFVRHSGNRIQVLAVPDGQTKMPTLFTTPDFYQSIALIKTVKCVVISIMFIFNIPDITIMKMMSLRLWENRVTDRLDFSLYAYKLNWNMTYVTMKAFRISRK